MDQTDKNIYQLLIDVQMTQLKEFVDITFKKLHDQLKRQQGEVEKVMENILIKINKVDEEVYESKVAFEINRFIFSFGQYYSKIKKDIQSNKFQLMESITNMSHNYIQLKFPDQDFGDSMSNRIFKLLELNVQELCPVKISDDLLWMYTPQCENLQEVIKRKGELSELDKYQIVRRISIVLSVLHENGLVHGNITLENLYYLKDKQTLLIGGLFYGSVSDKSLKEFYMFPNQGFHLKFWADKTCLLASSSIVDYILFLRVYNALFDQRTDLIREISGKVNDIPQYRQNKDYLSSLKRMYPFTSIYYDLTNAMQEMQQQRLVRLKEGGRECDADDGNVNCRMHDLKKKYVKNKRRMCKEGLLKQHSQCTLSQLVSQSKLSMVDWFEVENREDENNFCSFLTRQWDRLHEKSRGVAQTDSQSVFLVNQLAMCQKQLMQVYSS